MSRAFSIEYIDEINRLEQIKKQNKRSLLTRTAGQDSWQCTVIVYNHILLRLQIYLTLPLKLNNYKHQH